MLYFKSSRWKIIAVFAVILCFAAGADAAQNPEEFSSSLNPVGSGARATGMGGAFIGVADDATAASWNPAGLIQLEKPEVSAVYSFFQRKQRFDSDDSPEVETTNIMDTDGLNYASLAFPFVLLNRNMIISLNYQRLYEMDKEVELKFSAGTEDSDIIFRQEGFLYTLSPAMAVQILPELYIGATFNIWDSYAGRNGWDRRQVTIKKGSIEILPGIFIPFNRTTIQKDEVYFEGENMHFGFLWTVNDSIMIGGVYKTPFNAELEKTVIRDEIQCFPNNGTCLPKTFIVNTKRFTMKMPASYGLGLSYRHSDSLTVALDVYMTEWSRFVLRDENNVETNPLTGGPISDGRLKDTIQVRLGTEYLFIKEKYAVPVRFGFFYDPEPQTGQLDEYYGFSFGTGIARGKIVLDLAYQYRYANDITGDILFVEDSSADVGQHTVMMSAIYYFGS